MKITVTLSMSEAMEIIKHHCKCDVVVFDDFTTPEHHFIIALNEVVQMYPNHTSCDKLPAIKALRLKVSGLGLAEAKYAVENVDFALTYCKKHNEIPRTSDYPQF